LCDVGFFQAFIVAELFIDSSSIPKTMIRQYFTIAQVRFNDAKYYLVFQRLCFHVHRVICHVWIFYCISRSGYLEKLVEWVRLGNLGEITK